MLLARPTEHKINVQRRGTGHRAQKGINYAYNSGITLIALIITIIVLIILAGVTLSVTLGENGILTKSKQAVDKYQEAAQKEQEELDKINDNLESLDPNSLASNVKIGDYVSYDPTTGVDSKNLTYTSKRGSYVAKNTDGTYIIGEGAEFANRDDFSSYSNYNSDGFLYNKAYELIDRNGNLTAGSGEQGSGSSNVNDGTTDQTFTAKSDLKWRVLSIEDGCVNLISATSIDEDNGDTYDLCGITGYNYGIAELNNICKIYGHGDGAKTARSINVEDVNKLTGYKPENDSRYTDTYGEEVGYDDENAKWINTYYWYSVDSSNSGQNYYWEVKDSNALDVLFKDGENNWISYLLASRCVDSRSDFADFEMRYVYDGNVDCLNLFRCNSSGKEYRSGDYNPVRPVVTLKSTVKKTSDRNWNSR